MPNPIFARTRHEYGSYSDFWRLVELSGYSTCYVDEIDASDPEKTYIFTPANGETANGWQSAKARIIHWLLEWTGDLTGNPPGVAETWVSNRTYATLLGAKFVVMGSHPGLMFEYAAVPKDKRFDLVHLFYMIPRRERVINHLLKQSLHIAPNGWGRERHESMLHSKLMLNVHQHAEYPALAPLRMALAAAYHLPIVSEDGWSVEPVERAVLVYPYEQLGQVVPCLIDPAYEEQLRRKGEQLHQILCVEHTFRKCVQAALQQSFHFR